ncbi:MAG: hypothetical protein II670_13150 [Alphaproteobacteria bacterium]|nr:hypothetical protein [Alphaproteobacteria bacterium]
MKTYYILAAVWVIVVSAQLKADSCNSPCTIYQAAIDSISKSEAISIANCVISDSIYDLDRFFAIELMSEFPDIQSKLKSSYENSSLQSLCPLYSECLHQIQGTSVNNPKYIIFFSSIEDNVLMSELFELPKTSATMESYDYQRIAMFTESILFFFLIEGNRIVSSKSAKVYYN